MKWNKLSMAERAKYIQSGASNGITDLNDIRKAYNKYQDDGLDYTYIGYFKSILKIIQ